MSSAVPIHPTMRLARQRIAVAARRATVSARLRRLSTTNVLHAPARKGNIGDPPKKSATSTGNRAASSPSSALHPPSTSASRVTHSHLPPSPPSPSSSPPSSSTSSSPPPHGTSPGAASAAVRAYAASTRSQPSSPPPAAAFKVVDQRGEKEQQADKQTIDRASRPNVSEESKSSPAPPPLEGVQKMLGREVGDSPGSRPNPPPSESSEQSDTQSKDNSVKMAEGIIIHNSPSSGDAFGGNSNRTSDRPFLSPSSDDFGAGQSTSGFGDGSGEKTEAGGTAGGKGGPPVATTSEQGSAAPRHLLLYPFNTHEFIKRLQAAGFAMEAATRANERKDSTSLSVSKRHDPAEAIMDAVHQMLVTRGQDVLDSHMNKTEVENQAYLFTAALAELRTELQVRARNDAAALRSMVTLLQREVDSLNQRMREDTASMKHDIQVDMNNRKGEAKEEQNTLEQEIQDLNNRFTISISDLKTEIEQSIKWDATRRALTIFFGCIVILVATLAAADYLTRDDVISNAAQADKSDRLGKGTTEVKAKSAEELGLVAIEDDEHGNRYV